MAKQVQEIQRRAGGNAIANNTSSAPKKNKCCLASVLYYNNCGQLSLKQKKVPSVRKHFFDFTILKLQS